MTIQTKNLILATHLPRHLHALLRGTQEFESIAGLQVVEGIRDQLLSASSDFIKSAENAGEADPWRFGFGVIHKIDNFLIGMGGFPGPPNSDGVAEIAYGIAPVYQGAHRFRIARPSGENNSRTHACRNQRFHACFGKVRL